MWNDKKWSENLPPPFCMHPYSVHCSTVRRSRKGREVQCTTTITCLEYFSWHWRWRSKNGKMSVPFGIIIRKPSCVMQPKITLLWSDGRLRDEEWDELPVLNGGGQIRWYGGLSSFYVIAASFFFLKSSLLSDWWKNSHDTGIRITHSTYCTLVHKWHRVNKLGGFHSYNTSQDISGVSLRYKSRKMNVNYLS